jgi:5'-deoxynucleotidase YfbR-like HD superfamily hydrolase
MTQRPTDVLRPLAFYRRGGIVKRFHCFDLIKENTVGHHTFNVVALVLLCVGEDRVSKDLLFAAMQHDLPEQETGDIPAPFKRSIPGLREQMWDAEVGIFEKNGIYAYEKRLSTEERTWLKLADSLEGALFCGEEYKRGNLPLRRVGFTFLNYVEALLDSIEAPDDIGHPDSCPVRDRFAEVYVEARRNLQ